MTLVKLLTFLVCFSPLNAGEIIEVDWEMLFQNTLNETEPLVTALIAQQSFEKEGKTSGLAVDLGTGAGRDALFLLKKGWDVLAIDREPLAIEILLNRSEEEHLSNLHTCMSSFSEMILPYNIDLINAGYSLPFCHPEHFSVCWQNIIDHLAVGGRFSGQLFGNRDEYITDPSRTFHTEDQMLDLFKENFEIEFLNVQEGIGPKANGQLKYWHVFHIVAKKIKT